MPAIVDNFKFLN